MGGSLRLCPGGWAPPCEPWHPTTGRVRASTRLAHEHVLVELARAAARAAVHVAREALPEAQPRPAQDLRIEPLGVVHDDHHRRAVGERLPRLTEDVDHRVDVLAVGPPRAAGGGGADLTRAPVLEGE